MACDLAPAIQHRLPPLLAGIAWAAGFAALVFGTMNIITAFFEAIFVGLGIDSAIHLDAAYRQRQIEGTAWARTSSRLPSTTRAPHGGSRVRAYGLVRRKGGHH